MIFIFNNHFRRFSVCFIRGRLEYNSKGLVRLNHDKSKMDGQGCLLSQVVAELELFADPKLAEQWDNVGLLVEPSRPHRVDKVLLTNDLTVPVLSEAVNCKADLIISYHPPIFAPLKRITQSTWKEKIVATCLENKIAVYSPHTAWDATFGAVGDSLASAFSEYSVSVGPIIPNSDCEQMFDVMTCVGNEYVLTNQFGVEIVCRFKCDANGTQQAESSKEIYRIVAGRKVAQGIANLPHTVVTKVDQVNKSSNTKIGMGRLVHLKEPGCSLKKCVELMKCYTKLDHLRLAKGLNHTPESLVKTVAMVPGSGGCLLKGVSADLFVTGEMLHHDLLDATHHNTSVILTNHSDSERPYLVTFSTYLLNKFPTLNVILSSADKDPIETV